MSTEPRAARVSGLRARLSLKAAPTARQVRRIGLCALCLMTTMGSTRSTSPDTTTVDLALILAVDVSHSVDWFEYELQKFGISRAIKDPAVLAAIHAGRNRRIAATVVQWSGKKSQRVVVPWKIIGDTVSAENISRIVHFMPREFAGEQTNISGVLSYAIKLFAEVPYLATRKVVDISGDGRENVSESPEAMRDRAVAAGITINGLVIENEEPDLHVHYRKSIIGGPGAFVLPVKRYEDFAEAMKKKLIREIDPRQLSWSGPPEPRSE